MTGLAARARLALLAPLAGLALLATALPSLAYDPTLEFRIADQLARGERNAAASTLRTALAGEADPAVRESLLERLAMLLAEAGRHAEAADAWEQLAGQIALRAQDMAPELIPVWEKASAEHEAAGQVDRAIAAATKALMIVRSAGLPEGTAVLAERLERLIDRGQDETIADDAVAALDDYADLQQELADKAKGASRQSSNPDETYKEVKIYYATDRARSGSELPVEFYSGRRGALELGTAVVTVPVAHRPGQIEEPSIWSFEWRADPQKHIVLAKVTPKADAAVFAEMQEQMKASQSKDAFVFVHGFNVPFHEAAMRTAQMAYDMNFDGLPILYSWPSRGSVLSYIADTAVVNLSGRRLSHFLDDVVAKSGATRIHLVAHSMGNRALTDALELFALRNKEKPKAFDQVLFTAPDLDAGLFVEMMHTIRPTAERITLYASNRDWALAVSRQLHGDAPRAGQGGEDIVTLAEVDSIDMTTIGEDMLAHSYYANNPSALTDILALFWRDAPPEQRCGMTKTRVDAGDYWVYSPDQCDSAALLSTLSLLRRGAVGSATEARNFLNRYVLSTSVQPEERSRLEQALRRLFKE